LDKEMPVTIADGGFQFGHVLVGTTAFEVLHMVFAFPGFQTSNVLIHPNHPLGPAVLRANRIRLPYAITPEEQYQHALALFTARPDPTGV
jgi:hypothetical protein